MNQCSALHSREWCRTCARVWVGLGGSAIDELEIFPDFCVQFSSFYHQVSGSATVRGLCVVESMRYYSDFLLRGASSWALAMSERRAMISTTLTVYHRLVEVHCAPPSRLLLWRNWCLRLHLHLQHHHCFPDGLCLFLMSVSFLLPLWLWDCWVRAILAVGLYSMQWGVRESFTPCRWSWNPAYHSPLNLLH